MGTTIHPRLRQRARSLKKNSTEVERLLWSRLRKRQLLGCKFRRQQPLGSYIVDFVCFDKRVIIELDGGQHAHTTSYEDGRTRYLEHSGYTILRFWNNQVREELDAVMATIYAALGGEEDAPPPSLPPQGGEDRLCERLGEKRGEDTKSGSIPPARTHSQGGN